MIKMTMIQLTRAKIIFALFLAGVAFVCDYAMSNPPSIVNSSTADSSSALGTVGKPFIDYFSPTPIVGSLSQSVWGANTVGARDFQNGLEDSSMKKWNYWDGQIIKAADGKFHMFASRWDQATGHDGWGASVAVHAVSDNVLGPYVDRGLCWPDDQKGRGHNVTALVLPDGTYAILISETRPGDVFVSKSLDGPWKHLGQVKIDSPPGFKLDHPTNFSIMVRPDGGFEIIPRSGAIYISRTGILGPYTVENTGIFSTVAGLPQENLEDPCIWFSGGRYHVLVNSWSLRKAYHLTSSDGIHDWTFQGLAYDPRNDFIRYSDGTVNHWNKLERPGVLIEDGHVTHLTLAVIDVPKEQETGNDGHGSKVIVIPFDGAALDRDAK